MSRSFESSAPVGSHEADTDGDFTNQRQAMVHRQLAARDITDPAVLRAMEEVPRHRFVRPDLAEFAYQDSPLPIEADQTISQPYIVAAMIQALEPEPGDRVLEVGGGSGYAAAVLSRIVEEVYTIERHRVLAETARQRFADLGYDNIEVRCGDGTLGWPEHAPFDGIVVAAGGPEVPASLQRQLAVGGVLVIPVGPRMDVQKLVRLRRISDDDFEREDLAGVRFVPLVGEEGWMDRSDSASPAESGGNPEGNPSADSSPGAESSESSSASTVEHGASPSLANRLSRVTEPFDEVQDAPLEPLLERIGDARVVCLGEATHGTSEFYRFRSRLTRALVERKGFRIVALEADWPDAARVDAYTGDREALGEGPAFTRFPTWMWKNGEFLELVEWLRDFNGDAGDDAAHVYGLDLYSLHASIQAVLDYLDDVDPETADLARHRYGCLTPWQSDPSAYGRAALSGRYRQCEDEVVTMLRDLQQRRLKLAESNGHRFLDAEQNARLIRNAERYYRLMYRGSQPSWNLRDSHMFETLEQLLDFHGEESRAVVWAHNSHLGDARATEMSTRGEHNLGQLCRQSFGAEAFLVGFGTHHGTVAAAHDWGGAMEVMEVQPALDGSYESLCHDTREPGFLLPLRQAADGDVARRLQEPRLERAIGVIYRPRTERQSHYFHAILPEQFDEYVWIDETRAVNPLGTESAEGVPETYPFGV